MNKFINSYKLLLVVIAVMVFLPLPSLYAYDWDVYFTSWVYPTDDIYAVNSHWIKIVECDYNFDRDPTPEGYTASGNIWAYTDADIWSIYQAYNSGFQIDCSLECGAQKDWEWDGPPATAPGADISLDLNASAPSWDIIDTFSEIWDLTTSTADASAWGYVYGTGYIVANTVDNNDDPTLPFYWAYAGPDSYDWDPYEINDEYLSGATLAWELDDQLYYEVESQVPTFSSATVAYVETASNVSISTNSNEQAETWSVQYAVVHFSASCEMTSN